jgi:hypothetical protein
VVQFWINIYTGFSSFAQPYQPVGVENAHWFMFAHVDGYAPDHHAFAVQGDTIIGNVPYKKLYFQDLANGTPLEPPYLLESEYLLGALRDDSSGRKVYVIAFAPYNYGFDCALGEEKLLFDFSALPGDTIAQCLTLEEFPWIMDSSYVSFMYGANRKTLFTDGSHFSFGIPDEIFEGIGSRHGPLGIPNHINSIAVSYYHLEEYCIGSDEDCGLISGTDAALAPETGVLLYPNPATSEVRIVFSDSANNHYRLRITDSMGKVFLDEALPYGASAHTVSVTDWPTGVYFVQYLADGASWVADRVVVY